MITPRGACWPPALGAQQGLSSGAEPPTAATESGKLLCRRREGEVSFRCSARTAARRSASGAVKRRWHGSSVKRVHPYSAAWQLAARKTLWRELRSIAITSGYFWYCTANFLNHFHCCPPKQMNVFGQFVQRLFPTR